METYFTQAEKHITNPDFLRPLGEYYQSMMPLAQWGPIIPHEANFSRHAVAWASGVAMVTYRQTQRESSILFQNVFLKQKRLKPKIFSLQKCLL